MQLKRKASAFWALAVLLLFSVTCEAEETEGRVFRVQYQPNKTYEMDTVTEVDTDLFMDFKNSELRKEVKERGEGSLTKTTWQSHFKMIMQTGAMGHAGRLPFAAKVTEADTWVSDDDGPRYKDWPEPLEDVTMEGYITQNSNQTVITKIEGPRLDEQARKFFKEKVPQSTFPVVFPERPMKTGDTFSHKSKFPIPISDKKTVVGLTVAVHEITGMEGDVAQLRSSLHIDADDDKAGLISLEGSGKGDAIVDLSKGLMRTNRVLVNVTYRLKTDEGEARVRLRMGVTASCEMPSE